MLSIYVVLFLLAEQDKKGFFVLFLLGSLDPREKGMRLTYI
jgi:hypothetical protein